jgi:hypothetical protein
MIPVGGKSTSVMSARQLIEHRQDGRALRMQRQLNAELQAEDEANRQAGLRWHVGRTLWDLSELRACAPDCEQHSGGA